jgi:hypothetical protein
MTNKITKSNMKLNIEVEVAIAKEDDYFVAYCPALELSAYSDSKKGAQKAFIEEIDIFLEETSKKGTLEKYLLKNGWKLQQHPILKYEPPKRNKSIRFGGTNQPNYVRQQVAIPVL